MLARFLRIGLVILFLVGWVLGYALCDWIAPEMASTPKHCWSLLSAVLTPVVLTGLTVAVSAILSRNPAHADQWQQSVAGECWATVALFIGRQPWSWKAPTVRISSQTAPLVPVVLVHGYLCNHRIWDPMADVLLSQGHTVMAVDLEPVFGSIDNYAEILERAVNDVMQATAAPRVALVGHSMGGLAIRAWMRQYGVQRVAGVLTLGTPHQGTAIARASHTPNGRQMQANSAWLRELALSETTAQRQLIQIAITAHDNIVFPQHAQTLEGAEVTVFQGMGHLQMCTDAGVTEWVTKRLKDMPFQTHLASTSITTGRGIAP